MRPVYFIHVYRARDGWRWRLKAGNGRIVGDSGEPYARRTGAQAAAERVASASIILAPRRHG